MDIAAEQPRGASKACLSCHDGTIALDSFGGNNGSHVMEGGANVGTDLANDHPVSVKWEHQDINSGESAAVPCSKCHLAHGWGNPPGGDLVFFNGYVECASCHDVHNGTGHEKMLRLPAQNGQLCFHCHGK